MTLRADRGDLTVHMSCALHRSTHPTTSERRVAYTGFALPPREATRTPKRRNRACAASAPDRRSHGAAAARVGDRTRKLTALTTIADGTGVSVVTGAAGAMGSAAALALAPSVGALLLTDVDADRLGDVAVGIERESSANVCALAGDLAEPDFVLELVRGAAALGDLHALVHTAGLSPSMAGWREILRVDLAAVARLLDTFLPQVGPGSAAVCLASVSGHMGAFEPAMDAVLDDPLAFDLEARFQSLAGDAPDPGATYRLAKRAVIRLCERAAVAWGEHGGRVVSLSPGLIDTAMGRLELEHNPIKVQLAEMTPVGGARGGETILPGRTDDIANTIEFLCSERAAFVSGCDVRVDGGLIAAMNRRA